MTSRHHVLIAVAALFWASTSLAWADGTVTGRCRFEKIKGRPSAGYQELYEWNNYLSSDGGLVNGQSFRCGTGGGGGGYYTFTAPAGGYTMYVSQPEFFARAKVVTNVNIINNQSITINPELNLDYSCYIESDGWTGYGSPWYQTFVATGTSINRIAWKLAGWDGGVGSVAASVHESNGGSVTTWPQVGPTKSASTGYGDAWVGHRSGDISTVPGKTYAIKLTGQGGTGNFAIYKRTDGGTGYSQGQAYDGVGNPQNIDLHITVFSDNDGTVMPYAKTTTGLDALSDWAGVWGQTFRATGNGLAAADLWYASTTWDIHVRFRIFTTGPGGTQIGPTKTNRGAYRTGGVGLVGVSYAPGEVPLTPGNTYYIEMAVPNDPWGFTPYKFNRSADNYPYGHAYMSSGPRTDIDLSMNITEYAELPTIVRNPATLTPSTRQGQNAASQTFTVANGAGGTLNYTITDDVAWLSVSPATGTSTGEADTITVSYTTSGLSPGQHTGTITISDPGASNSPQTIVVTLTVAATAPTGFYQTGWNLTSVPVEPFNTSPTSVFQDLISLGNVIENNLYRYDTGLMTYVIYPSAGFTSINRGHGYWLWLSTAPGGTPVSVAGTVATSDVTLVREQGWSLIGHPHAQAVLLSACQVKSGVTTKSFDDAVAAGWVSATLYYWDTAAGYRALNTAGYGDDVYLRPWRGYWMRANIGPISLIVPKPA